MSARAMPHPPASPAPEPPLRALLTEGFHLLALLRDGASPQQPLDFPVQVEAMLARFLQQGSDLGLSRAALQDALYAFCALMDETILASDSAVREVWARAPLQLRHFGEHLAGEGFFQRLASLRRDPAGQAAVLEVFHFCLLLGFQGKYRLEGEAGRRLLIRELGQELQQARGGPAGFAPRWEPPPPAGAGPWRLPAPWAFAAMLALAATVLFLLGSCSLRGQSLALPAPPHPRSSRCPDPTTPSRPGPRCWTCSWTPRPAGPRRGANPAPATCASTSCPWPGIWRPC